MSLEIPAKDRESDNDKSAGEGDSNDHINSHSHSDLNKKVSEMYSPLPVEQKSEQIDGASEIDNLVPEESQPSILGSSCKVLESMLRINVDFPNQKVVNLIAEYEDYLEETGLLDIKDVKRRKNLQNYNDEEDAKSVDEGDEKELNAKLDPSDLADIPVGTKNLGYYDVLKGMITRMELEGTLGKRREYGRTTKGGKINEQKDEEYFYNLDDEFIDDAELVNNESMNKDFSQHELANGDESIEKFYNNFEFLPCNKIKNFSDTIKAKKRKRMEDEQISDQKINDKMSQLEKAVHENKDGPINYIMQEISLKLKSGNQNSDSDWLKYKEEIYLRLQRIFKESNRSKILQILNSFVEKQN